MRGENMRFLLISGLFILSTSALAQAPEQTVEPEKEPMSETAFFAKYRALFNKADTDFNGQLTRHERSMAKFEDRKPGYENKFKSLDTNFDGYLSFNEIRTWHENDTERRVSGLDGQRARLLDQYDRDKNGTISPYELDEVFKESAERLRSGVDKNATRDMNSKDSDDSGSVSLDEYLESKAPKPKIRQTPKGPQAIITPDNDWDGVITRTELTEFLGEMFNSIDKNEDGELSASEQRYLSYCSAYSPLENG